MSQVRQRSVPTPVGALHIVDTGGEKPVAVLWHSLFVDSRSWSRAQDRLAAQRRLVLIDGPGHGGSADPGHRYTLADCAAAARAVLDVLDVGAPVDWLGNAWGGHVGIVFAARWPERCRTLTTVGTPVHPYPRRGRLTVYALLAAHRLVGPADFLVDGVVDALLSPRTRDQDPQAVDLTRDSFRHADRAGLRNAVISISLRRPDLTSLLPRIQAPTLFITGTDHSDWTPAQADAAGRSLAHGSVSVLEGTAYLGPLEAPDACARIVGDFWASQGARPVTT